MFARISQITFHSGTMDAALQLFQTAILPQARLQPGFHSAFMARKPEADHGLVITIWETEAAMLASAPPPALAEQLTQWRAYIADVSQDTYEVIADS